MEKITLKENSIEKPKFLYHGTVNKDISEFDPKPAVFMTEKKNLFFTTPVREVALAYMYGGSHWSSGLNVETGIITSVFPTTREQFIEQDKGGAIYKLDSEPFSSHIKKHQYEWVTDQKVKPVDKEVFDSALESMEKAGIKLYFLGSLEKLKEYMALKPGRDRRNFLENLS